ncbi:MAG: flippase-like domain-containing protein [Candidatus Omnitrophica bacterium]|nr:flippase-like domain-containing protein [Candidatus Omnitrophota bacterium]
MRGFPAPARWLLLLVLIALLGRYAWEHREDFPRLAQVSPVHVGVIWIGETLFILSNAIILRLLLNACGTRLPLANAFALTAASGLVNYVAPLQAGLAVRAYYLRDVHAFPMVTFAALSAVAVLMNLVILGSAGLICLAVTGQQAPVSMLGVLALAALGGTLVLILARGKGEGEATTPLERVFFGFRGLRRAPRSLWLIAMFLFFNSLILTSELWVAYRALGHPVPFETVFLMNSMRVLTILVTLTPGNLGVVEGVLAAAGTGVGEAFPVSFAAAGLLRLANFAALLIWGGLSLFRWTLYRRRES